MPNFGLVGVQRCSPSPPNGILILKIQDVKGFHVLLNIDLELMFKRNPGTMMLSELCLS